MSAELTFWLFPLFFLGSLVLISRLEQQISTVSRESYRLIAGGVSVLAVVALANLYRSQGLFGRAPFLSEAVFFDLITWIFGITGSIFVVSGVSHWLPIARKQHQADESTIRKLDLLKKIEQLLGVETRLDMVLATSVDYMVSHFEMRFGAVYKYSNRRHQIRFVGATAKAPTILERLELPEGASDKIEKIGAGRAADLAPLFSEFPGGVNSPAVILPIITGHRPVGFFLLWGTEDAVLSLEDELTLKLAIDAIVRNIETDKLSLNLESELKQRAWKEQLELIVNGAASAREAFSPLVQLLGQRIPTEFAALALVGGAGEQMQRLSWGPGGRVLVESGLPLPAKGTVTADAFYIGEIVAESELGRDVQPTAGEILVDGNVQSLLAVPIVVGDSVRGVLTLASSQRESYSEWEMKDIEKALPILQQLVGSEILRRQISQRDLGINNLSRFVEKISQADRLNEVFAEAAGLISDEVGADIVRISTPNTRGAFLKSRTLVLSRPFGTLVPANGELIVSLMPLHEQVLRNGQAMLSGSDRGATNLVEFERQQAFAVGVRSSMIVPVPVGGETAAVISVASMNDRRRLHRDSGALTFVESVARCLVPAVERFEQALPAHPEARDITPADCGIVAGLSDLLERRWTKTIISNDEMYDRYLSVKDRPFRAREDVMERGA